MGLVVVVVAVDGVVEVGMFGDRVGWRWYWICFSRWMAVWPLIWTGCAFALCFVVFEERGVADLDVIWEWQGRLRKFWGMGWRRMMNGAFCMKLWEVKCDLRKSDAVIMRCMIVLTSRLQHSSIKYVCLKLANTYCNNVLMRERYSLSSAMRARVDTDC